MNLNIRSYPVKYLISAILSQIVRMDILEDCGVSLSPEIDVGQVEGSAIMGIGMWTTEKLQYDENTGELLTRNTWVKPVIFYMYSSSSLQS